ncbi:RNA polymerase subunit sigma-70 [Micromonospora costi]|uniref:RNA polymerase subunit sigma-70 n=1 Tax=Micromonospora costi TaxID=1530042 RepID=UPI0019D4B110|nr:RNA polymerase subunit sigma-70 [Micromonospora costi]
MGGPVDEDFTRKTAPLRPELLAYCYRMLGAVDEAEDAVQETMLRGWRSWSRYDPARASVRTWLYAVATNVCLTALEGRQRRPLPTGLGQPSDDPDAPLTPRLDVPWLQPLPDARLGDPQLVVEQRGSLRLALAAALHLLPARQRAVLILRDVLRFTAAEVAGQLGTSVASVNSALQRARDGLAGTPVREDTLRADDPQVRATVDRYVRAFEAADVPALVRLLADAVILEMPPVPLWYAGRVDYGRFMSRVFALRGRDWRILPSGANGQPTLAAYCRAEDGIHRLHTVQILTVATEGIRHNVVYQDPAVFRAFGLPDALV